MISRRFIKSSLIYTVAGALPMASAIILLPFYIYHLSTDQYGVLSIYMAFSLLIQILVTFSFDTSVYIHFHELKDDRKKLSEFISSAFICTAFIGLFVGVVLTLTGDLIFRYVFTERQISFYPFGLAAVGSGIFQAVFKVYSNLLQSRERPVTFLWANVLTFSLIASLTIAGLQIFPGTLTGPIFGRLIAVAVSGVITLLIIFREFGIHFNLRWLRDSFSFNGYTFLYQIQQWMINYVDRFIMFFFLALHDVGVYDFAFKCLIPLELLMNGLHSSFYPRIVATVFSQTEKKSTVEINRYYHGLTATMMLLVSGGILVVPWIIEVFVNKASYRESIPLIPFLAILYILRATRLFFAAPFSILKYTKPLSVIYFLISIIKIGLILIFIKQLEVYAVILAAFVVSFLEVWLLSRSLDGKFHFQFNSFKLIIAPAILCTVIVFGEFVDLIPMHLKHACYVVVCLVLLLWFYRNEIRLLKPWKLLAGSL